MSKDTLKGYQFKIVNGAVTAVYEVKDGRVKLEKMERDESWSVSGNSIIKSETEHGRVKTTVYSDADGDGIYTKVSNAVSTEAVLKAAAPSALAGTEKHDSLEQYFAAHDDDKSPQQASSHDAHENHGAEVALVGVMTAVLADIVI